MINKSHKKAIEIIASYSYEITDSRGEKIEVVSLRDMERELASLLIKIEKLNRVNSI